MGHMRGSLTTVLRLLGCGCIAVSVSACGLSQMPSVGDGGIFSSKKAEPSWTPIITEDSMITAARTNSDGPVEMAAAAGCPPLQVEGGQRYVTIYESNRIGDASAVIHRAEITKTARECQATMGVVQVKYGLAGRVLLGPKGKPGAVTLSIVMQVLDKAKNKVKSETFNVSVNITTQNPISYFALVRDVAIPVRDGTTPQDYTVSFAFEKKGPGAA